MTATSATIEHQLESTWNEPEGLAGFIGTVDHKRIGMRYLYTGFFFFFIAGLEAIAIRIQLSNANLEVLNPDLYNQIFTMHGITMMFLFATPVLSGFGNFLVPLMIGARDMAFPRLNAFGYWVFFAAGLFLHTSFLLGQAPNAGWFNYVPLSAESFTPGLNIEFYTLGLIFITVSTTVGAINFLVTIFKQRAPGMTLDRIPIFVWGEVAFSIMVIFGLPPLTVANVLLYFERRFGWHFFDALNGGDPVLWQHLFWIFGHPEVYLVILPALGMVSAILPTHARRPIVGYIYIVLAELFTAVISFGVWVHHMFAVGLPTIAIGFISAASFMVVIPSGTQIFAWLATLLAGKPKLTTPMLWVFGFLFLFVAGGLTGAMFAAIPFDQAVTDSYFVVAHFHYVLAGGALFPMIAGLYHWGPKMLGRKLNERVGKWSFWLSFIGFNIVFFPMHIMGLMGQPRRTYTYDAGLGWTLLNQISSAGVILLVIGLLLTLWNWIHSRNHGEIAGNDPWGGDTLEWATTSPPPEFNFLTVPEVRSREPMWDQPELQSGFQSPDDGGRPLTNGHFTLSTASVDARPQAIAEMPAASPWPFFLTMAIAFTLYALVFQGTIATVVSIIGAFLIIGGFVGWFWPRGESQET